MGYQVLPDPGSEFLCRSECRHTDCTELRRMAGSTCRFCDEPIGYGMAYYLDDDQDGVPTSERRYVHAGCLMESLAAVTKS